MARSSKKPIKDINRLKQRVDSICEVIDLSYEDLNFGTFIVDMDFKEQFDHNELAQKVDEMVQSLRDAASLLNTSFKLWFEREEQAFVQEALKDEDVKALLISMLSEEGVIPKGYVVKGDAYPNSSKEELDKEVSEDKKDTSYTQDTVKPSYDTDTSVSNPFSTPY